MAIELNESKISVHELELGMFVTRLDRPWEETSFLIQGFLIESPEDIQMFIEQCEFVFIETKHHLVKKTIKFEVSDRRKDKQGLFARGTSKTLSERKQKNSKASLNSVKTQPETQNKITYINKIPVEKEFNAASKSYKYAKLTAKNIMDGIRIGRALDINECRQAVDEVVGSILRNSNALMWLSKLRNKDEYTAEHSLNVCILSVAFAKHLGLDIEEIMKIGMCGLLHDVGKAKIPLEIINKPGRFTEEEFELMKQHCLFGRDLLMTVAGVEPSAIDVAYSHHERMDENGYPRRLMRHQIPYYARIIAITDTYDAITSSRCYDEGRSSTDALDVIYKSRGRQFDEELALEFIKCIGIYPPGAIVEMSNGEVGIVIASNKDSKLRPKIMMVLNSEKQIKREKIVDLRNFPKDDEDCPYEISCELPNKKYGVDIKTYLKRGLVLNSVGE